MKKTALFILCLFVASGVFAQTKHTISGYVEDVETGEKLIGANVYDARTLSGTTTNVYGFYSLTLPADSVRLAVSFIGYETDFMDIDLTGDRSINFEMQSGTVLKEVEVKASLAGEKVQERTQMSSVSIPMSQVQALPSFLGEVDVIKALQLMPGVQSGSEASSGLYVRGGGPDQNLILLDGVPVYNVSHLFGFFSVFNADAINSVELIKGGFPARYGGRLSSVVDIRMKEGNMKRFGGSVSIGLISAKATIEGPIVKDKTSFIISGRRTYIDLLMRPVIKSQNDGNVVGYYFYDLNGKLNHKFSDRDRLYLSAYGGKDKFYYNEEYEYEYDDTRQEEEYKAGLRWGNITAMLRWNHIFSPKMFSNITLTYSRYALDTRTEFYNVSFTSIDTTADTSFARYYSGIVDWSGKFDVDYVPTPAHYIKFGLVATHHRFKPGAQEIRISENDSTGIDINLRDGFVSAGEFGAYVEDDYKISNRIKANIGLHLSGFLVNKQFYAGVQPRVSARYLVHEDWSLKASYAYMTQYIHLLSSSSALNLPTDLWVPATENVKPQQAHQVAFGVAHTFKNMFEVSVEAYYKKMNNLIEYREGSSYLDGSTNWERKVANGSGDAYGTEFFVQKKTGKTTGWVGYTLSWSNRKFEDINFGETYPYKYDRRHDVAIAIIHRFNDKVELSGSWVYGTGNAVTLPTATYLTASYPSPYEDPYNNAVNHYESRNGYRMNNYHRMDIGASFTKKEKKR